MRPNSDGLLPVAGDGSVEWDGYMPTHAHPRMHNPVRGWVASANEMNLPADFDHVHYKPGFEWPDPSRSRLIASTLSSTLGHELDHSLHPQTSYAFEPARALLARIRLLDVSEPDARTARELLLGWDGVLDADSGPALLFEVWFRRHLIAAVADAVAPGAFEDFDAPDVPHLDTASVVQLMRPGSTARARA